MIMTLSSERRRLVAAALLAGVLLVLLSACAAAGNEYVGTASEVRGTVGFWWGLWHGIIAPITFIVSLFTETVGVYEVHNNGGWYDVGFLLGASMVLGGGPAGRSASRRRRR
ncbi:MAG TPA: hypothetical protein PKB06_01135 [Actinotalea sp.]|nr:hypothetical protein [Actinotalea sp.]